MKPWHHLYLQHENKVVLMHSADQSQSGAMEYIEHWWKVYSTTLPKDQVALSCITYALHYKNLLHSPQLLTCPLLLHTVLNVLAELIMAWMMLSMSLGWTLGSSIHPFKHNKQLGIIIFVAIAEVTANLLPLSPPITDIPPPRLCWYCGSSHTKRATTHTTYTRIYPVY